ncbi:PLP-dependent aminotransferase family protein [Paenibacillus nanensis]|uniref:PLP-dependent aminotransferase family protein n=1 Tax=Paenibacillus nanensis TaxID=393251 RepID=A0A3A1VHZ8_9BACL|nr:PLP-dependent aminotransferase family protein [Paenibacillus nanensis]RIX60559.1 PLP-dependent aminotransferase family protein [Paenibacillus nanensis]
MQLYRHLRTLIHEGVLKDGTKLPSILSLRNQIKVSKTTIETAYHMLLEEGYVYSKERSGLYVIHPGPPVSSDPPRKTAAIDFSLLAVDKASFPMRLWKAAVGESLLLLSESIHQYGDPFGEQGLRDSLAHYLRSSRGVVCSPEQIVIGSGFSYVLQLLSKLFGKQTKVGMERYSIAQVRTIFDQHPFHIVPFVVDENKVQLPSDEAGGLRLLYTTPSHRPAGAPLPYAHRLKMLQWAYENDGFIIEDDYDGELRISGKPVPAIQGLDRGDRVIYIGTFSKAFTPAIRINYMVLPRRLLHSLQSMPYTLSPPSRIDQTAVGLLLSRGHWYRHLRRMNQIYRKKYELLASCVQENMPQSVTIHNSGTALHMHLSVEAPVPSAILVEAARKEGVIVYESQDPDSESACGLSSIYLGFGGLDESEIRLGVQRLKSAWSSFLAEHSGFG